MSWQHLRKTAPKISAVLFLIAMAIAPERVMALPWPVRAVYGLGVMGLLTRVLIYLAPGHPRGVD